MRITPPVIQIALDYATIEEAIAMAKIGKLKRAYPDFPVLADYKTMDSGGKNVMRTQQQGGQVMTVCGHAPDETVQAAVAASKQTEVWVVVDLIGVKNVGARARQCEQWGVNMVYLHYGADQRRADATRDSTQWIDEVMG